MEPSICIKQLSILSKHKLDKTLKAYASDNNPHRVVGWLRAFEQARAGLDDAQTGVNLPAIADKLDSAGFVSLSIKEITGLADGIDIDQDMLYEQAQKSKENMAEYIISFAMDDIFRDKSIMTIYPEEKKMADLLAQYDAMPIAEKYKHFGKTPAAICAACNHHAGHAL